MQIIIKSVTYIRMGHVNVSMIDWLACDMALRADWLDVDVHYEAVFRHVPGSFVFFGGVNDVG